LGHKTSDWSPKKQKKTIFTKVSKKKKDKFAKAEYKPFKKRVLYQNKVWKNF
jgi:hypothetical protein